jgi:hypothetical protein
MTPPNPTDAEIEALCAEAETANREIGGRLISDIGHYNSRLTAKMIVRLKASVQNLVAALRTQSAEIVELRANAAMLTVTADWDIDAYYTLGGDGQSQIKAALAGMLANQIVEVVTPNWLMGPIQDDPARVKWKLCVLIQNGTIAAASLHTEITEELNK